jgi:hypothetical protein
MTPHDRLTQLRPQVSKNPSLGSIEVSEQATEYEAMRCAAGNSTEADDHTLTTPREEPTAGMDERKWRGKKVSIPCPMPYAHREVSTLSGADTSVLSGLRLASLNLR